MEKFEQSNKALLWKPPELGRGPGGEFNPASPEADIHPTKAGYAAMAGVVGATYLSH